MIFFEVLAIVTPVFGVGAVGYLFARRIAIDLESLTNPLFYVFAPCLIFSIMAKTALDGAVLARIGASAACVTLGGGALAWGVRRLTGAGGRGFYLPTMFANNANMGMSLSTIAFGETGLAMAAAYYVTTAMLHVSVGITLVSRASGRWEMFRAPVLYAAIAGILAGRFDVAIPGPLLKGIELLGQPTIPVMLFSLGYRLATVRLGDLERASLAVAVRIGGGLAIGSLVVRALHLEGAVAQVVTLQSAMPAAVLNFVIAEKYHADPELVASAIALGTFVSLVTTPLVLAWVL